MADTLFTDILTSLRPGYQKGGVVTTPKRGLVDGPGSYAAKLPFTKKQKTIAEAFAKKKGIKVEDLTGSQRKDIRDGMYTLDSLRQTKSEKNFEAGKVRKLNNLKEFKPIDPNTGKIYTKNKWLSLTSPQRSKAMSLSIDAVGYKQRLKKSARKKYLKNREKIIAKQQDYYYEGGGKEKQAKRRDIKYKKGPLKGKAGLLQAENNRLLKYMSVAAEYGNPKFEIYEENGKFAGVRDTDKNIIYRDHRYKGNKGVPITAHPDYKNTMIFAKTAKKFKYDRPNQLLGSYFAKYDKVPTYAEMYNFFQRDPRVSERTKIQNPLELHHMATMEKYPTKSYQLALFDKNTGANKIINDYNTPGSDAFKNKALANKRLKELNIRLKIGGEFLGGGAKTAEGALAAAKTRTTDMFKKQFAGNPKLADEMAKYLGISSKDVKNVKNFAAKKGFVLNNFAGALNLSQANIDIPPSVRKSLSKIVRAGKTLGKGAVVLDPMFAAMDFSKAMGEGVSGGQAASYTGQKFLQDIFNLPRTLEDLAYVATDKGTFKNFGEKENRLFSYEPRVFADEYLQEKIKATPEATRDFRKARIDYAKTLPIIDYMDIPMSQSDAQERERAFYLQRGVEPPEEETDFTYDGIMGIVAPKGVI
jgi:hypothetical protein